MTEKWKASKDEINEVLTKIKENKLEKNLPKISSEAAAELAKHIRQLLKKDLH